MADVNAAMSGGLHIGRTVTLLFTELVRLLENEGADGAQRKALARRSAAVWMALQAIKRFVDEEQPRIKEAFELRENKDDLHRIALSYVAKYPDGTDVGVHLQHALLLLHQRVEQRFTGYPSALYVMLHRRGPPVALLARTVVHCLRAGGYSWREMAPLVDDQKAPGARAERLRKHFEAKPGDGFDPEFLKAAGVEV